MEIKAGTTTARAHLPIRRGWPRLAEAAGRPALHLVLWRGVLEGELAEAYGRWFSTSAAIPPGRCVRTSGVVAAGRLTYPPVPRASSCTVQDAAAPATAVTAAVNKDAGVVSRRHRTPRSPAPAASPAACTTHAGPVSPGAMARSSRPLESDRSSTSPGAPLGPSAAASSSKRALGESGGCSVNGGLG